MMGKLSQAGDIVSLCMPLDIITWGEYISVQDTLSHGEGKKICPISDTSIHHSIPFVEVACKALYLVFFDIPGVPFGGCSC
jgi:hypothetical protein